MSKRLKFIEQGDLLTIHFIKERKPFVTITLVAIGILIMLSSTWMFNSFFTGIQNNKLLPAFVLLAYLVVLFLVGRNLVLFAFTKEQLEISPTTFSILNKNFLQTIRLDFEIEKIKRFQFAGFQTPTDHPIGNTSTDFTGLAEREKMVSAINDSGNITFLYNQKVIRFGKNIPSWDYEILYEKLKIFIGNKLDIIKVEGTDIELFDDNL